MYIISAPIAEDLVEMIAPYREKYDPLAQAMPPHISILKPFEFPNPLEQLSEHLVEISETYSPIKVSIVGWDVAEQAGYQLRLPLIAGRQEFTTLRQTLLAGPLSHAANPNEAYWPHIVFGRFTDQAAAETAKESLKELILSGKIDINL